MWFVINLSCRAISNHIIDVHVLKKVFITSNNESKISNDNIFYGEFICDTIYNNNYSYNIAIKKLLERYDSIEGLNINIETKQYIKSLLLAEWVYGSFNIQFLGPALGLADTSMFNINFNDADIGNCYFLGNTNRIAVWCGDRTKLFIRLADSLLHLKAKMVVFKPTHVFPLVEISGVNFIFDPYDPFILFDENLQTVIDYNSLKANPNRIKTVALRTKRNFGCSGELVSKEFYKLLKAKYANNRDNVGTMISEYLSKNRLLLACFIDSCTFEFFGMNRKIFPVLSPTNSFVLFTNQSSLLRQMKISRFNKYYLGLDCKINQ